MLTPISTATLIQLTLLGAAIGFVITGTLIGYPIRVLGYLATKWCPPPLGTVFFCPYCCSWWMGLGVGFWAGLPWQNCIQIAFTSCLAMAMIQAEWGLAADDKAEIAELFGKERTDGQR